MGFVKSLLGFICTHCLVFILYNVGWRFSFQSKKRSSSLKASKTRICQVKSLVEIPVRWHRRKNSISMLFDTQNYRQKPRVFWGRPTTFRWHTQGYCTYFGLCRDPGLCCSMSQRIHQRPPKQGLPSCLQDLERAQPRCEVCFWI